MLKKVKATFITAAVAALAAFGVAFAEVDLSGIAAFGFPIGAAISGVVAYFVRESRQTLIDYAGGPTPEVE